ncbi:MAG: hypothetical protein HFI49_04400, partial [Bacilli bacterium]|nr:hypothetical protein [Bacilli bacterium]
MKKVGSIICIAILIGLIIFVSTKTLDDGHLRIEGIRVRVPSGTLLVEECVKETENVAYCEKNFDVNDKEVKIEFKYQDFKESGYPTTLVATINGHEFFKK